MTLIIALWACNPATETQTVTVDGFGSFCLAPNDTFPDSEDDGLSYAEDAAVWIHIDAEICLSSSCDTGATMSCSVSRDERDLTISSSGSYNEQLDGDCTDDCGFLTTSCETDALEAGLYSFIYGDQSAELTVPSTGVACSE